MAITLFDHHGMKGWVWGFLKRTLKKPHDDKGLELVLMCNESKVVVMVTWQLPMSSSSVSG